jgi:8-oxo-dGTP diphosphatase
MTSRPTALVAVHCFLRRDNQILLLKRFQTGYKDGWWSVPAGHVERGEPITTAMVREVAEETGISVDPKVEPVHVMHRHKDTEQEDRIDYFFVYDTWEGEPTNAEPHKCSEVKWVDGLNLPNRTIAYVNSAWEHVLNGSIWSEFVEE